MVGLVFTICIDNKFPVRGEIFKKNVCHNQKSHELFWKLQIYQFSFFFLVK